MSAQYIIRYRGAAIRFVFRDNESRPIYEIVADADATVFKTTSDAYRAADRYAMHPQHLQVCQQTSAKNLPSAGKIYVDDIKLYSTRQLPAAARHFGNQWAHLWADDVADLHEFADVLGLKRSWFQDKPGFPHYVLTPDKQRLACKLGAILTPQKNHQPVAAK